MQQTRSRHKMSAKRNIDLQQEGPEYYIPDEAQYGQMFDLGSNGLYSSGANPMTPTNIAQKSKAKSK